ncbi:hypothetical protein P3S67_030700 [Capsicum chacoense]
MNFIIWNCRGSRSPKFRGNFRNLLDYHRPALVALLETHQENHQTIPQEFQFSNVIAVPGTTSAGGIAILWHEHILTVTAVALMPQEIHCKIQVIPSTVEWLFSAIYVNNLIDNACGTILKK